MAGAKGKKMKNNRIEKMVRLTTLLTVLSGLFTYPLIANHKTGMMKKEKMAKMDDMKKNKKMEKQKMMKKTSKEKMMHNHHKDKMKKGMM